MKQPLGFSNPDVARKVVNTLVANTPVAYLILDRDFRIHFVNDYFIEMRHLRRADVLGNFCYNVSSRGFPCEQCAVREAIASGAPYYITRMDILHDGARRWIDDFAVPLFKEDGSFDYILEMMVNRTAEMQLREQNDTLFMGIVDMLTSILDQKDPYTSTHSRDVTQISAKLAARIGLDDNDRVQLRMGALLHDIGKIRIPDGIINKPGRLTPEEMALIRSHPSQTLNILGNLNRFAEIRRIAGHHHERWDGGGYPDGLRGEDIPFGARILAIADTYDAMTSNRPYRHALTHQEAVDEIRRNAGTQFDPDLAKLFAEMATTVHVCRQALVEKTGFQPHVRREGTSVKRVVNSPKAKNTRIIHRRQIAEIMSSDQFAREIIRNSPAYYLILDAEFNVLFASDNLARTLNLTTGQMTAMRSHDFMSGAGGENCPVARSFRTGMVEEERLIENFGGHKKYLDAYAVPLDLENEAGEPFPCVMQIMIDRTAECFEHIEVQDNIKSLLDNLYSLLAGMDAQTTRHSDDIIRTATGFRDYLEGMSRQITRLSTRMFIRKERPG